MYHYRYSIIKSCVDVRDVNAKEIQIWKFATVDERRLKDADADADDSDDVLRDDDGFSGDERDRVDDADGDGANVGASATEDRDASRREDLDARARARQRGDA